MQTTARKTTSNRRQNCKPSELIQKTKNDGFTLFLEGLDDAIMGLDFQADPPRVIYSAYSILQILIDRDNMEAEEALEFYDYNIFNLQAGAGTPIFCDSMTREEIEEVLEQNYGING